MPQHILHIHLVSDSTGETVHQIARACFAQFPDVKPIEHVWTLVRTTAHLDALFSGLDRHPGILLMSIIDQQLRATIENACRTRGVPATSVLDPVVNLLTNVLGQAMTNLGADVIKVKGNYEKSLIECIKQSTKNNWQIVQDVAWKNYMQVPKHTMAGYSVMMREIVDQVQNEEITHIILQAGVGGMAGAMLAGVARYLNNIPVSIIVEPDSAACVLESIKSGKIEKINIKRESLMGGMSCGEVSLVPWEILKNSVKYCLSLPDDDIAKTMRLLGNANFSEEKIIAGENSAPGVISLIAMCENEITKEKIKLNENSNILLIGCEGDTDQEMYQKLINQK